ncbi:replication initiation protein [Bosea sp. 47.2.35]|uniref:replication initiation protein n=1 Tax=Bosea sp. 47.2.35 TaxID=2969304 RepID=UPI00214FB356|nr:replication initiation protein [Bosea sp. 47.2.35]MCR4521678.1 replication initiation protein [Bosea sp. 47.2.35]
MGLLRTRLRATSPSDRTEDGLFRPAPRGDLSKALASREDFRAIAPESPRPVEMLEHVTVKGDDRLSADDIALHELLVDHAYRSTDRRMDRLEHSIPTAQVLTFLGGTIRRAGIKASLARLRGTTVSIGSATGRLFEDVQLLVPWTERDGDVDEVHYIIPKPIAQLMASQRRYAYIELEPMSRMRSRYGIRLYRHLAAALRECVYDASSNNLHEVLVPVEQMADWLGFRPPEGKALHVGQLKLRAVDPAIEDLFSVRHFQLHEAQPQLGTTRGNPIVAWRFVLRLMPKSRHEVRPLGIDPKHLRHVGGVDDPAYRVDQVLWLRAAKVALDNGVSAMMSDLFDAWLIALNEALTMARDDTAMPVSDGHYTQRLRGERLLIEIEDRGTQAAAWAFAMEEIESPDLIAMGRKQGAALARDARKARFQRYKATAKGKAAVDAKASERKAAKAENKSRVRKAAAEAAREAEVDATTANLIVLHLTGDAANAESFAAEMFAADWTGSREIKFTVRWDDDESIDGFEVFSPDRGLLISQDDVRRLAADSRVVRVEVR